MKSLKVNYYGKFESAAVALEEARVLAKELDVIEDDEFCSSVGYELFLIYKCMVEENAN